jgi:hypothetical protein
LTTPDDALVQPTDSETPEDFSYTIDPNRTRSFNRSLAAILYARRCEPCRSRLQDTQHQLADEDQIKEIAECCPTKEEFIRPEMPMQEIIFRTILSEKNQSVSLEHLQYLVTDRWYTPANPRNISSSRLKQVLDNDLYYGFTQVSP